MAKQKQFLKLPENVNFDKYLEDSLNGLNDLDRSNLLKRELETLDAIKASSKLKHLLAEAIKSAAVDGLEVQEVNEILRDATDLIFRASTEKDFEKLLKNPGEKRFKLTQDTIKSFNEMSDADKAELKAELVKLHPDFGDHLQLGFEKVVNALKPLEPIFKIVAVKLLQVGEALLLGVVNQNIANPALKAVTAGAVGAVEDKLEDLLAGSNTAVGVKANSVATKAVADGKQLADKAADGIHNSFVKDAVKITTDIAAHVVSTVVADDKNISSLVKDGANLAAGAAGGVQSKIVQDALKSTINVAASAATDAVAQDGKHTGEDIAKSAATGLLTTGEKLAHAVVNEHVHDASVKIVVDSGITLAGDAAGNALEHAM